MRMTMLRGLVAGLAIGAAVHFVRAADEPAAAREAEAGRESPEARRSAEARGSAEGRAAADGAAGKTAEVQAVCPVTDRPIDRSYYTYLRGKRVYLASAAAREQFEQDPLAYAEGVREQWAVLRPLRVQVRCPITGGPISLKIHAELPEHRVYFATEEALEQWEELDSEARYERLAECYTYQATCGTCQNVINPTVHRTFKGREIYFCCPGCPAAFATDPEKYLKAVDEQIARNRKAWQAAHPGDRAAGRAAEDPGRGHAEGDQPGRRHPEADAPQRDHPEGRQREGDRPAEGRDRGGRSTEGE